MQINPILLLVLTLTANLTFGQLPEESIRIKWKMRDKEIIAYKTTMTELEETKFQTNRHIKSLLDTLGLSSINQAELEELMKELKNKSENFELISTLQKANDLIYVRMIRKSIDQGDASSANVLTDMTKGIQFRGYLTKDGTVYSYYLKNQQKNILAIFFQLPPNGVKVGDSWTIDSQWFSNDHTFKCDKAERTSEATLKELKIVHGDTVAIISYNLKELLAGTTQIPWNKENINSTYKMTYTGNCAFNVSKGRWEQFAAVMETEASGFQNIKQKVLYSLIPYKLMKEDIELLDKD